MLVAIFILFKSFFGGASPDELKEAVEKHVHDSHRAEQVVDALDEVQKQVDHYAKLMDGITDQIVELNQAHDSSAEQYHEVLQKVDDAIVGARGTLLDLRFEMKEHMTKDEWAKVFPAPKTN